MFGVILSEVPVATAGVGCGVLATTQQTSFALGTGLLGTLFVSLAASSSVGPAAAFRVLVGIDAAPALLIIGLSTRLPDPRRGRSLRVRSHHLTRQPAGRRADQRDRAA